jgi:hypothetical protein
MNPVPGGLFQRKDHRVAHVYSTWLAGMAKHTRARMNGTVVTVDLPDSIAFGSPEGDHAEELGRTLIALGEQVLVLNGTRRDDQDDLIVAAFVDGEGLGQASAALFHRFIAYREGAQAHPLNDLVVDELLEIGADQ